MWSETVGLSTRPVWDQKIGLSLGHASLVSCLVRRHNDLEGHSNFSSTIYCFSIYSVLGTSLLWRSTVAFTDLKIKSAKCLCLLPVVLVIRIWSCLQITFQGLRGSNRIAEILSKVHALPPKCSSSCNLFLHRLAARSDSTVMINNGDKNNGTHAQTAP